MPPAFEVAYRPEVLSEDFPPLPRNLQLRIVRSIETRLQSEPARYGQRLRRSLGGLWKLRVGDYRIIYELKGRKILVWAIRHRKNVYDEAGRRRGDWAPRRGGPKSPCAHL